MALVASSMLFLVSVAQNTILNHPIVNSAAARLSVHGRNTYPRASCLGTLLSR
jgi:hypothetical protein